MAEVTIAHLTEVILAEGEQREKRDDAQLKQLATLNKSFDKFFKAQQLEAYEELEASREAKPVGGGDNITTIQQAIGDAKGGGFIALFGRMLLGAIYGLAAGFILGLTDSFLFAFGKNGILWKGLAKTYKVLFGNKFVKSLTDGFKNSKPVMMIRVFFNSVFQILSDFLSQIRKGIVNSKAFKNVSNVVARANNSINSIVGFFKAIPDAFAKSPIVVKGNQFLGRATKTLTAFFVFIKRIGTFFGDLGKSFKSFFTSSTIIQRQIKNFQDMFKSFQTVGTTVKKGAGIIQKIQRFLEPFFSIFKRIGRFLGGPILMGLIAIVDGFIGGTEAFKKQSGGLFPKILAAINGFFSGMIAGFIGGLLDLGKMAVGFVAGLFPGGQAFKDKLAEFSFRDMIFDALMFPFRAVMSLFDGEEGNMFSDLGSSIIEGIKNIFKKIKDFVADKFKGVVRGIANFFGLGDDEEIEPPVKEIKDGQVVAEVEKVEVQQPEPRTRVRRRNNVQTAPNRDIDNVNNTVASISEGKQNQNINVPIVDNSSNVSNTSSNMAVYGDASPASDDLDIVA
jgi:hypothetical protein